MIEITKQRIENKLIDEIRCLNATMLEVVGHYMICALEGKLLIHHGINKNYKPSGYTVDSFSSDASIIGEYSTETGYFTDYVPHNINDSYKKIRKDVEHAFSHVCPDKIEKIYLISNQLEPQSFRGKFNKTDIFLNNSKKLIIYDAAEMAKIIYKQSIENDNYATFYRDIFPLFSQLLDDYSYFGKLPARCENFCSDPTVLKSIENHFNGNKQICILHGMSGSGKTQMSIDYFHYKKEEFQNYIWITGDDWKSDTSLNAVQRTRGGAPINVAGIFNNSKTILIIDSIERIVEKEMFAELNPGFKLGGIVLATSQLADAERDYYLAMPPFSENVALSILGEESFQSELTQKVVRKCKAFPLVLSTIRYMVETERIDRRELYQEILKTPEYISGKDGVLIIQKVLNKLDKHTLEKLRTIANTNLTTFDIQFLRKFVSNLVCHRLQQLSIIMPTNVPGVVKIHDLICIAMKDEVNYEGMLQKLAEYIEEKKGEMTPSILRQIHLAQEAIYEYKSENKELDWLTYAAMQIEGKRKNALAEEIFSLKFEADMPLPVVMCLIEAKEVHGYSIDKKNRKEYYKTCIMQYSDALGLYKDIDRRTEILHHLGKTLRRNREYEEAYNCFMELLEIKPQWHATYGQIVTLGTMSKNVKLQEAGKKYMKLLLENMLGNASEVPLRVSLAAISRLRSYKSVVGEMIDNDEKVGKLSEIAENAALEDIGQFFEAFVAITSMFSYHYSKSCILLAEKVPEMIMVTPEMIEKKQWVNACEALTNLAVAARDENKIDLERMLIDKAVEFADKISLRSNIDGFEIRAVAKAYNRKGIPEKAIAVIEKSTAREQDHWLLYRKAEAEMLLEQSVAINTAKNAYKLLIKDAKNMGRKSSYLELLSKCYEKVGELKKAKSAMIAAINNCSDEKYKEQLKIRLEVLKS